MTKSPFDKFANQPSTSNDLRGVLKGKKIVQSENAEASQIDENPVGKVEIEALEAKLKEAEAKARENQDRYLRTLADFENSKKRMDRERLESIQYANEKFIQEILPVFDSFEMTLSHLKEVPQTDEEVTESKANAAAPDKKDPLLEGVELVFKQLQSVIEKFGVQIVTGEGEPFDPNFQESIGVIESVDYPAGTVAAVHRKGFKLGSRLIRPALVSLAKETVH